MIGVNFPPQASIFGAVLEEAGRHVVSRNALSTASAPGRVAPQRSGPPMRFPSQLRSHRYRPANTGPFGELARLSNSQESALKLLTITLGTGPACTGGNRVLRLLGFLNCKYDPAYRITIEYPGDSTRNCEDFRLDILAPDATLLSRSVALRKHPDKHTNSERDWAWVLHELAQGKDGATLRRKLASRRADKPNPLYYAQRTVDVASARLWLIEGVPIDDVATMLEVRRCFEIPIALCRASAREIARTAQRMIAWRKVA